MTTTTKLVLFALFALAGASLVGLAAAAAQTPAAADAPATPAAAIQVANSNKSPIVAVYTSVPGRSDWGDDMIGKGKILTGKSATLKFKTKPAACKVDVMAMLDNGDTHTQADIDLCAAQPNVSF